MTTTFTRTSSSRIALGLSLMAVTFAGEAASAQDLAATESEEIIITAERTNRSLKDTASSVVVLTGADIEETAGAYSTNDVIGRIPNLVVTPGGNNAPTVRGVDGTGPAIGANAFFAGTRSRLNYQVDGRTLTFNEVIYIDGLLWDIQQIEVYRGPQSTLQGRNAVGGVVAIKTTDPDFQWSGRARGVIGNYDTRQISGAVGGPLASDILAFRVAADYREEQSFVHFVPYTALRNGVGPQTTEIEDPGQKRSLALRGKLLFTPAPEARALITVSHIDAYAPQTADVIRPFEEHNAATPPQPRFQTRADAAIADVSWDVSDAITLSAFLTASDFRITRFAQLAFGNAVINGREYSAEPRVRFRSADGALSGFLAGYIFSAHQDELIDLFGGGAFRDETETKAVFGEAIYQITPAVEVTLGARYENEDRDRTGFAGPFAIDFHESFSAFLPRATVKVRPNEALTFGATVGRGYNAGGAGFAFEPPFPSFIYGKETVTNYEVFMRTAELDGRLRLGAHVFFNDYDGLQLPFDINPDPALSSTVIRNAERATTYGAELETRLHALDGLEVFANAGLLQTKINRYGDPTIEGNELPRSPAVSLSVGLFATPVEGLDASFDVRYTDAYYSDVFNDARGKTDPYTIANAQLGYRVGPARLFVAATNLFDTTDVVQLMPGATYAADAATISQPRRITGGVEFSF